MPGRQSTGPPSAAKTKTKKRNPKRSLNALAIAEQEHPAKERIRQSRLGLAEQDDIGRKRAHDEEDSDEASNNRSAKRLRAGDKDRFGNEIEGGSDSEGNEWVLGQVGSDDDSDLDSDAAMGKSDEEKFEGFAFRGSSSTKSKPRARKQTLEREAAQLPDIDLNEDEANQQDSDEESDGLGDEAIDLADALDQSEGESTGSGSESESNPEDFGLSDSSDADDTTDPKKLAFLGDMIFNLNDSEQDPSTKRRPMDRSLESTTPSEFGLRSNKKLTLADLQASISDPALKKSLKILASNNSKPSGKRSGIPKKLEVPLAKRQQDRLDRAAAYDKSKETLNRWIDTVKHNRRAEHLSFPLNDPTSAVAQASQRMLPTTYSKPVTELEGVIQNILQASGLAPTNGKDGDNEADDFADLPANNMSLEEVQVRHAELRRARDLLFREEKRAKRIKKIKSKSYRKVHRKERERNAQREKDAMAAAGADDSEEEQERNDRRRAEERMGQRHRDSRWAKSVKDSGRAAWDEDARSGVTEMARRGEELRRRIEGRNVNKGDDDTSSETASSDDEYEEDGPRNNSDLLDRLDQMDGDGNSGMKSTLSSMPFMQKANSLRRAQNDAEAESIRRELNGEDSQNEEGPAEAAGRRSYGPSNDKPPKAVSHSEQKSEFEERPPSDEEDENEIRFPKFDEDDIEVIVDAADNARRSKTKGTQSISRTHMSKPSSTPSEPSPKYTDNPWLSTTTNANRKSKKDNPAADAIISNTLPSSPPKPRSALKGSRAAGATASQASSTKEPVMLNDVVTDSASEDEAPADPALPPSLQRNREFIARAFAGDAVVADFSAEKDSIAATEAPQKIDTTLPGWGSWVGDGITKQQRKQNANRFFTTTQGIEKEKRKDAKLKKVIINEKRVKKNGKYLASSLPHPFETKSQYERSLRLPVGPEWTTKETFQGMTKPRVMVKQGVIEAMKRPIV